MFRFICILLIVGSSTGCAMGLAEKLLGENLATHADDQSAETGGNQGFVNKY